MWAGRTDGQGDVAWGTTGLVAHHTSSSLFVGFLLAWPPRLGRSSTGIAPSRFVTPVTAAIPLPSAGNPSPSLLLPEMFGSSAPRRSLSLSHPQHTAWPCSRLSLSGPCRSLPAPKSVLRACRLWGRTDWRSFCRPGQTDKGGATPCPSLLRSVPAAGPMCVHAELGGRHSRAAASTPRLGKNTCAKETAFHPHLLPGHRPAGRFEKETVKSEKLAWKKYALILQWKGKKNGKKWHPSPRGESLEVLPSRIPEHRCSPAAPRAAGRSRCRSGFYSVGGSVAKRTRASLCVHTLTHTGTQMFPAARAVRPSTASPPRVARSGPCVLCRAIRCAMPWEHAHSTAACRRAGQVRWI